MQVTDLLKDVHATGQTNSDLKSDNICLGEHKENLGIISQLKLIDFGLAQKFADVDPQLSYHHLHAVATQQQLGAATGCYQLLLSLMAEYWQQLGWCY